MTRADDAALALAVGAEGALRETDACGWHRFLIEMDRATLCGSFMVVTLAAGMLEAAAGLEVTATEARSPAVRHLVGALAEALLELAVRVEGELG